ncbi:bifunctional diaminohydroxyphosphoribosylaminopyrimidine deaminase/5-amino-6-(5-phosphoribosylamino)uracil reductase RibD [Paraglaciecola chathamensis]|uniref:Riboflavin biosynthesis protein RibD n=1 Tax=Paraglaciecola chathamensis S18K6 TaxID=1127672 RepID=A0AAV3V0V2_9ALTE|nr:bifunctional diaminohydroxyphosphoribosylaminopyrimidine deaminase/5-amino-6-(5-phosphoribosylamino)uracil reductase RibD [Paraglaciecola chathamensis]GAC10676.1 diaminohydroxyphosphoribosylaminopyrimidine deaminase [Paraglaciecola chathamensis S18K6]
MTQFSALDAKMMALAIRLAEKGQYTTSPNPNVGCVITDPKGNIVGQGWHQKAGTPHAEIHAIAQAGERTKGATAYVTLEPCNHHGRTGPCSEALIKAGVSRVVAAMVDPNPLVAGSGLQKLSDAGVAVSSGLLEREAKALNLGFIKRMKTGIPWVTVKLASSLDGKTALNNGESQWITGPLAREDVQRHRAKSCAILSGSGTVLADNPSLNVRYSELGNVKSELSEENLRQPVRILLDGRNQMRPDLHLFSLSSPIVIINSQPNTADFPAHVEQYQALSNGAQLDLQDVMKHLGQRGFNQIWVEAGAKLAGALLQNKLIDELILYQAPKLLGDKGRDLFAVDELTQMQQAFELQWQDVRQVGPDLKLTARLT